MLSDVQFVSAVVRKREKEKVNVQQRPVDDTEGDMLDGTRRGGEVERRAE